MGKTAFVSVKILGDAKSAIDAMGGAGSAADRMQRSVSIAAGASAAGLGILTGSAIALGDAASQAEQAAGAVESVFGDYVAGIHQLAEGAADAVGLSAQSYEELAAVLGSQLKNMGVPMTDLTGKTSDLITLGGDLAATFGGTTSDAVAALSSLLRGERDPIEKYGVSIKQADINAKLAQMGLSGLEGEAAKAAETQATLALLTDQTAAATGQFNRELDTAAGQQQVATANWEDAQATLGEAMLPVITEVSTKVAEFSKWLGENAGMVQALAVVLGSLAGIILAVSGALKIFAAVQAIQTAAQWASNAAWLSSPITWLVLAIVALIALIVVMVVRWDEIWADVQEITAAVVTWFQEAWANVCKWFQDVWAGVAAWWQGLWQSVGDFFVGIGDWIGQTADNVGAWVNDVATGIGDWWQSIWQSVGDFIDGIAAGVSDAWANAMQWLRDVVDGVTSFIQDAFSGVFDFIGGVIGGIQDAISWAGDLVGMSVSVEPTIMAGGMPSFLALGATAAATGYLAYSQLPDLTAFGPSPLRAALGDLKELGTASRGEQAPAPIVYNITIEGALDKAAAGREVYEILRNYARTTGRG